MKKTWIVAALLVCSMPHMLMAETAPEATTQIESTEVVEQEEKTEEEKTEEGKTEEGKTEEGKTEEETTTEEKVKKKTEKKKNNVEKKNKEKTKTKLSKKVIDESDSAEKDKDPEKIDPRVYGESKLITKKNVDYIGKYIYFNQGDECWNHNGYRIAGAGCGPTSMAVVISNLTGKWVTPVETAIWGYKHGYYSSAGAVHQMIPDMAEAYHLKCKGVGTDYDAIKKALKEHKLVVSLMGPGYFTRKGHFMVLLSIDKEDNVTIADVGSRRRTQYKYPLSEIISQSKTADAGGPFWVISNPEKKSKKEEKVEPDYRVLEVTADISHISQITVRHTVADKKGKVLLNKKKPVYKDSSYSIGDKAIAYGKNGTISKLSMKYAIIRDDSDQVIRNGDSPQIPFYDITVTDSKSKEKELNKVFPFRLPSSPEDNTSIDVPEKK